jgi:serine/threonine protein kinase
MIGTVLHDRWRILSELGKGGMGEVFLVEHLLLGRKEALKILMPSLATDPQFVSRFRREARAVNRLRHPNIISVYDFGQLADERFYLSMEYADGDSVHKLLKRDRHFAVPRALQLLGQLAYAVHHAHSRGVVHRDLKPDNLILVGEDETLKVLDFGIAKIVASDHNESVALSGGNQILGTARYLSPERVRGVGNDPRSDLYSLGCIAFELVVGGPPFSGNSDEVIRAHLKVMPDPPSAWQPLFEIPKELDAVILRCLAKKPEDRYQTAAELFAALRKVPGYPAPRSDARRRFVPVERSPTDLGPQRLPTDPVAFGNLRGALREVAEGLLDLGLNDVRLVSGLAHLRDHEQSLASIEAALDALEHEVAAIHETSGDRETSLRFALGELQYAAAQPDRPPELDARIRELEARLAAASDNADRLQTLGERRTAVAGMREKSLEHLKSSYDALDGVVAELVPSYASHPTLAPLAERLERVRSQRPGGRAV